MSIWTRIADALSALASGEGLSALFDRLRPPPEKSVAFTIAVIALGAKMAKADGEVTRNEVAAFRQVFAIPPGEEANAARVFNLARQDVAEIFGVGDRCFRSLRARFVPDARPDPHDVLGIPPEASLEQARAAWKQAVRDSHPDRMLARGVPEEAVKLAEQRLIAINAAWEEISSKRAA
jgi:DnaJ like chaperone protein